MKTKIFTLFTAFTLGTSTLFASDTAVDGIYYDFNATNLTASVTYRGSASNTYTNEYTGDVVIPESVVYNENTYSVTSIGSWAFTNCSGLTSVTIPHSVTSIGSSAFSGCSGLTSVTIPNSVTSIGEFAFDGCSGLTSVTIPNSVTSIDASTFRDCSGLISVTVESGNPTYDSRNNCNAIIETATNTLIAGCQSTIIPNSVESIGYLAFCDRSGLASITIPNSVTSIGVGAFSGCSGLRSVIVESGNPTYDSRNNCNAIIETATNTLIAGCQSTIIPNSVTSIGEGAFAFCSGLTSITIPNSVTSIGESAFAFCSGLTSVTIPNSVTSIGDGAFGNCNDLTSVTIPNSVTSIGEQAFGSCSRLTSITVESGNPTYDSRDNCNAIIETATNTLIAGCQSTIIPTSVTSIGRYAFADCSGLTSVTIPNSVTSISEGAFWGCSGLTEVSIGNSVTSIEDGLFGDCSNLQEVFCTSMVPPQITPGWLGYQGKVYVPCGTLEDYMQSDGWNVCELEERLLGDSLIHVACNTTMGTVAVDTLSCNYAQISATPNTGYDFIKWSDGVTENPRTCIVDAAKDTTFTAYFKPGKYHVMTIANNPAMGSVTPASGVYEFGSVVTLTATPNVGYKFDQWSDGNTNLTRSYKVEAVSDTTFTAIFEPAEYMVFTRVNDAVMGSVTPASGLYDYSSTVTLTAVPNVGYEFVQWSDGVFLPVRAYVVDARDTMFTAIFEPLKFHVSAETNNPAMGSVTGAGLYHYNSMVTLTATPATGYKFVQWSDGNTNLTRSYKVEAVADTTFTAIFKPAEFEITTAAEEPYMGTVTGTGIYEFGSIVTLTAVPKYGYVFDHWSDGVTSISRAYRVEARDTMFTAYFAPRKYMVSLNVQDASCGTTNGSGMYDYGTVISLSAVANYGYEFSNWSDGCTDNPRILEIIDDVTLTAEFIAIPSSNKLQMLFIGDEEVADFDPDKTNYTVKLPYGTSESDLPTWQDISWIPGDKYQIIQAWQAGNSVVVTVTSKSGQVNAYVISFIIAPKNIYQYTVTTNSSNEDLGTTIGSNIYNSNVQVEIGAFAKEGAQFYRWNDTIKSNPYKFIVTQDSTFLALFLPNTKKQMVTEFATHSANFEWERKPWGTHGYWIWIYLDKDHKHWYCKMRFYDDGTLDKFYWGPDSHHADEQPESAPVMRRMQKHVLKAQEEGKFAYTLDSLASNTEYFFLVETLGENDQVLEAEVGTFATLPDVSDNIPQLATDDVLVVVNETIIDISTVTPADIYVYTASGQLIDMQVHKTKAHVNVSVAGVYIVRVGNVVQKVVVK